MCLLAESPMWHQERNSIWWVDIETGDFFECQISNKKMQSRQVLQPLSLLVQCSNNGHLVLLAVSDGLLRYNLTTSEFKRVLFLEEKLAANRLNDDGCDAAGRLWVGTMKHNCEAGAGKLYCIESDGNITEKLNSTTISNRLCWNRQQDKMYYIDSATYQVQSYANEMTTANIVYEKTAIEVPQALGMPDGMAIDEEGMLWIAHWGGFSVHRWNPYTGVLIGTIKLSVPQVTSCAFGGTAMNRLFITTARAGMSEADLALYPLSGSVFYADLGVKGIAKNKCSL